MVTIIIFIVSIVAGFFMLILRDWQIKTARVVIAENDSPVPHELSLRHLENFMLYLGKYAVRIVMGLVVLTAKYWFLAITKTRIWLSAEWPKIHDFFVSKDVADETQPKPYSFMKKAIIESKIRIRRVKEKVRREHEEE